MTGVVVPVYAGIVVSDMAASAAWYAQALACAVEEGGERWTCLRFSDHSSIELFAGDPDKPGETFPSYGGAPGPPVMPGYAVEDPELAVEGLSVARSLPDWHVVVAPDGLRVVLTVRDADEPPRFAGFRYTSPMADDQRSFLTGLGVRDEVAAGPGPDAVPLISADRAQVLTDPDGTMIELVVADGS